MLHRYRSPRLLQLNPQKILLTISLGCIYHLSIQTTTGAVVDLTFVCPQTYITRDGFRSYGMVVHWHVTLNRCLIAPLTCNPSFTDNRIQAQCCANQCLEQFA